MGKGLVKKFHLGIDAFTQKNIDENLIKKVLLDLPKLMEMKTLTKPIVCKGKTLSGYTGFIIIEESHIAIHHFSSQYRIWIDTLSCKSFDKNSVIDYLKKELGIKYARYF